MNSNYRQWNIGCWILLAGLVSVATLAGCGTKVELTGMTAAQAGEAITTYRGNSHNVESPWPKEAIERLKNMKAGTSETIHWDTQLYLIFTKGSDVISMRQNESGSLTIEIYSETREWFILPPLFTARDKAREEYLLIAAFSGINRRYPGATAKPLGKWEMFDFNSGERLHPIPPTKPTTMPATAK